MFFSQRCPVIPHPDVFVKGEKLNVVPDFKYLGVILNSQLSFQKHAKKVANFITFNLVNFRHIRPYLTTEAEKLYALYGIFSYYTLLY